MKTKKYIAAIVALIMVAGVVTSPVVKRPASVDARGAYGAEGVPGAAQGVPVSDAAADADAGVGTLVNHDGVPAHAQLMVFEAGVPEEQSWIEPITVDYEEEDEIRDTLLVDPETVQFSVIEYRVAGQTPIRLNDKDEMVKNHDIYDVEFLLETEVGEDPVTGAKAFQVFYSARTSNEVWDAVDDLRTEDDIITAQPDFLRQITDYEYFICDDEENPEEPGEDPEDPGEDPEDPGEDPEDPGEDPEDPGEDPEDPGEDPEEPGEDPEDPGEDPEEPTFLYPTEAEIAHLDWVPETTGILQMWEKIAPHRKPGEGIVICVVDAGIYAEYPDMEANMWVNEGEIPDNGIDDDGNGYIDDVHGVLFDEEIPDYSYLTYAGHGSYCASIISMEAGNDIGGAGLAYGAKVMMGGAPATKPGYINSTNGIKALYYARDNGADIGNMSYAGRGYSAYEYAAFKELSQDMLLVGAAGNYRESTKDNPYDRTKEDYYPAGYDCVIGVMGYSKGCNSLDGSCWDYAKGTGPEYEVIAPYDYVYGAFIDNVKEPYGLNGGTSASAPIVCSMAAIMMSEYRAQGIDDIQFFHDMIVSENEHKIYYEEFGEQFEFQKVYLPALLTCGEGEFHTPVLAPAVEMTCTEDGRGSYYYCAECGKTIAEPLVIPAEHSGYFVRAVPANCTQAGHSSFSYCTKCYLVLDEPIVYPAMGHDVVTSAAIEVTCTSDGMTEESYCSRCHTMLKSREVVKSPGHNYVDVAAVPATVYAPGSTACVKCDRCGEYEVRPRVLPQVIVDDGIVGFSERLYTCALGRDGEDTGVTSWAVALRDGADGATVARGFFFSPELTSQELSDEDFVTRLYLTFLDREPDEAGLAAWVEALEKGATREQVFDGFVNSVEWATICYKYGIKSGGTAMPRLEPSAEVLAFVERLYTTCLGREADGDGLKSWADALANHEGSGSKAAHGFFFSKEFLDANYDDEEFVTRLYLTFMDREPDSAGFEAWVSVLKDGASREKVFDGFARSSEFVALCEKAGIVAFD
ncbi:MAG: DUF4214 domain-containing protein [Saccharofermentans sp.]|nr:DUF4214 domain-containing protein [Saccharofermentans sp.]